MFKKITPVDIKKMNKKELEALSADIRREIIETVAENGGHLASNLGMVEATVALHKSFDSPNDKIIFDVGHQCYAHKLITGRGEDFSTLRQSGGISGFPNVSESEHDIFTEGHSGTSLSQAVGIAHANKLSGKEDYVVAVIGDGSFTNGMVFEALNNCFENDLRLIILLNDNDMSIGKNIGGLNNYFSNIRTSRGYYNFKSGLKKFFGYIPLAGKPLIKLASRTKDFLKRLFNQKNLFENFGVEYIGAVDGHDIEKLCQVLEEAKKENSCTVVHMITKKGKGYGFAEEHPENYHSAGRFNIEKGAEPSDGGFSRAFGEIMVKRAEKDEKLCAVTAAMTSGTGLDEFSEKFKDRFFDVGIAEEHAVTFSAGLSRGGYTPVCALYSTFSQRAYDQVFHDVAIQGLPLLLALDRSGIVPGDGITHQGIFDYPLFSSLPRMNIYAPESYGDLEIMINSSLDGKELSVIRYPKGKENIKYEQDMRFIPSLSGNFVYTDNIKSAECIIITYGRISCEGYNAARLLDGKISVGIIKLKKIFPICFSELEELLGDARLIFVLEEGIKNGGVGEKLSAMLCEAGHKSKFFIRAIEDYVDHGSLGDIIKANRLDGESVASDIEELIKDL